MKQRFINGKWLEYHSKNQNIPKELRNFLTEILDIAPVEGECDVLLHIEYPGDAE